MKKHNRLLAFLLSMVLLLSCLPYLGLAEEEGELELATLPLYIRYSTEKSTATVAFADEDHDIPYISLTGMLYYLDLCAKAHDDPDWKCNVAHEGHNYWVYRENGSYVYLNGETQEIQIKDIQGLRALSYAANNGDFVSETGYRTDENGEIVTLAGTDTPACYYLERGASEHNFANTGYNLKCNLYADYEIRMIEQNDELYIPIATMNDIFLKNVFLLYNGEALFFTGTTPDWTMKDENGLSLIDIYHSVGSRPRSQKLADFTYNELCMFLDLNYGLAREHGVTNGFQEFFSYIGLEEKLRSTDGLTFETALCDILLGYFSDKHSTFVANSSYAGRIGFPVDMTGRNYLSITDSFDEKDRFKAARNASGISYVNEDGQSIIKEAYSEVGDTAFITFDEFLIQESDYYNLSEEELEKVYAQDTMGLVIYANRQINREGSPIRKVVIDLSCNGGGVGDACVYIAAWILGQARVSVMNPITKGCYTTLYKGDVNLNGIAGEAEDHLDLSKLDVYCLTSDCSFSCGNLLPAMIKQDKRVTLIGQKTGGGACLVQFATAADGSTYRCSGFYKLCTLSNGSYESIDDGVEPDIPLRKPSSYYDREWLVSYLDTIR